MYNFLKKSVKYILLTLGVLISLFGVLGIFLGFIIGLFVFVLPGVLLIYLSLKINIKAEEQLEENIKIDNHTTPNILYEKDETINHAVVENINITQKKSDNIYYEPIIHPNISITTHLHEYSSSCKKYQDDYYYLSTFVVGIKYDSRQERLENYINHLKKEDYFMFYFDDMSNKEIKEHSDFYEEPVWEISNEFIPRVVLENDYTNKYDSNALKVIIDDPDYQKFVVGYIPKEDSLLIDEKLKTHNLDNITAIITGGKYKIVDTNDRYKTIYTKEKPYGLNLSLRFSIK